MRYDRWRKQFTAMLTEPDMPLLTPVPGGRVEELLYGFHKVGIRPERAANLFNRRFELACSVGMGDNDGVQESTIPAGQQQSPDG